MTVAFCSLINLAASVMNCSGLRRNFAKVLGETPCRIAATVRRISWVFPAISPSRSYFTCEPALTVSVWVWVVCTAKPAPLVRSSVSSCARCCPACTTYCSAATLRCLSRCSTALRISSPESNSTW